MALLGIDFGSTNTCACLWDGKLRMIEMTAGGATTMPTVVTITDEHILVGQDAVDAGRQHPDFEFRNFKRRIAEKWHEDEDTGFQTGPGEDGMLAYRGPQGHMYPPIELSSHCLAEVVDAANAFLAPHDKVTGAVIGVPATFDPAQIEAIKEAARRSGLETVHTLEEPVAAALANGFEAKKTRRPFVVDFGGGTLDTTILSVGGGHNAILAKNGIADLGGADFDQRIAQYVVNLWMTEHPDRDLSSRDAAMARILVEAEAVKKRLSDREKTTFRVDNIDRSLDGISLHMIYEIDRRMLSELTRDLQERVLNACKATIEDARRRDPKFSLSDITDVLLVGGMTRMPAIRQLVTDYFGKAPRKDENPEQVVAQGCAIKAAIIEGRRPDVSVADITTYDLAIETTNNVPAIVVPRGTPYPLTKTVTVSNAEADQTEISLRLVYATKTRAQDCHLLEARDIPVEPAAAETLRLKFTVAVDRDGTPSIQSAA